MNDVKQPMEIEFDFASHLDTVHKFGLGIYLTPSAKRIDLDNLKDIFFAVNKKFAHSFDMSFDFSLYSLPMVLSEPEIIMAAIKRGEDIKSGSRKLSRGEIQKHINSYGSLSLCEKVLADYPLNIQNIKKPNFQCIITNDDGKYIQSRFGGYSLGASVYNGSLSVVNWNHTGGNFGRYITTLHEVSHNFGAKHFDTPFSIMSPGPLNFDYWGPLAKYRIRKSLAERLNK